MAEYPGAVKNFTTRNAGDTIQPAHINDLQDEVTAIESGLLNGTAPLTSSNTIVNQLGLAAPVKGELLVGSTSTYLTRLTVGSNRQVLMSDTSATPGVKWAAPTTYALRALTSTFSPADATTYYFGGFAGTNAHTTTAGIRRLYIPATGRITYARFAIAIPTTVGTAETSSAWIRLNNTTDTAISAGGITATANFQSFENASLSLAVTAGDYIEIKWTTPTWATNPLDIMVSVDIYIEPA